MNNKTKTKTPLVSLIVNDLANNGFGRAYLLGRMLEPEFRIEVVGFASGPTWLPCRKHGWPEKSLPFPRVGKVRRFTKDLAKAAEGDLILLCKPLPLVLDVGDKIRKMSGRPCILDIDDWEFGWFYPLRFRKLLSLIVRTRGKSNGLLRTWRAEGRTRQWPVRLVSNRFLQKRFGGTYIPHACDTEVLNPVRLSDRAEAGRRLGLDPKRHWIGFIGSPKPHKGVDILLEAVAALKRKDLGVLIAGADQSDPEIAMLRSRHESFMEVRPPFAKEQLGEVLAAVEIVALPQLNLPSNWGQVPAKVFDAMAMKIPVIASSISDLPEVLEGCGVVVPPGDVPDLSRAIATLIDDPRRCRELGEAGRKRCVERYSFQVVGERLRRLIRGFC
ncbi:MAG: glycosyltransferase family 4 protein [Candidatus Erginobacter occultus]|nr:glycosyltransferase family 4 protein [Candidatus Erginobacter occultus]